MSNSLRLAILLGWLGCATAAEDGESGQSPGTTPGLDVITIAEKRRSDPAAVEFIPADQLRLGDEIYYTVRVHNASDAPVSSPVVVKAIPRNTRYVDESAVGPAARVEYSVDGGASFGASEELSIATVSGQRRATADDFTHIRWVLRHPLAPSATALLRFRGVFR